MVSLENTLEYLISTFGEVGFVALAVVTLLLGLLVYIYKSIALMTIAKKTRTPRAWLAWIPLVNIALMAMITKRTWAWVFIIFLNLIPIIGSIAFVVAFIYLWWKICERRKLPGPLALLNILSTIGYLVLVGIVAWYNPNKDKKN